MLEEVKIVVSVLTLMIIVIIINVILYPFYLFKSYFNI